MLPMLLTAVLAGVIVLFLALYHEFGEIPMLVGASCYAAAIFLIELIAFLLDKKLNRRR